MSILQKDVWAYIQGLRRDVDSLKRRDRGYTTVQDGGTAVTVRDTINFTGATITDDATNAVTNIAVTGGGSSGLPYCESGQFRSGVAAGGTNFRWTNASGLFVKTDAMFALADSNTAISINSEGTYAIMVRADSISGATTLTSDRTVQFEYDTNFGYTAGGGGNVMGSLTTGQPALAATPAGYFSEYTGLRDLTFWQGGLANIGLSSLPLKVRPLLVINSQTNPFSFSLSMSIVRIGDLAS